MRRIVGATLILLAAAMPEAAHAWGKRGHAVIDRVAVEALPADGPVFLKAHVDYIAASASIPDGWRGDGEPFSKIAEDPNHGWFREQFRFLSPIPRSRHEFILALFRENQRLAAIDPQAALRMNVRWAGTMPFAIVETYGRLVAGMRRLRADRAAGIDTAPLEQTLAFYTAWMGHYVGDGAQPMHASWHSDGWHGPNPKGYDRDGKIHGRFESAFVDAIALAPADIAGRLPAPALQQGDVFDAVLAFLDTSGDRVETVFQMDQRGAFNNPADPEARALVYQQTAMGAAMLRDLLCRAWAESALPPGGEKRPHDPAGPRYNPETGSAPAFRPQP